MHYFIVNHCIRLGDLVSLLNATAGLGFWVLSVTQTQCDIFERAQKRDREGEKVNENINMKWCIIRDGPCVPFVRLRMKYK